MSCTHICSPLDPVSQSLETRQATTKFGIDQLRAALNDEHYLMAGRPAGNTIWQGIYPTDPDDDWPVLCAVLCWSGAALRLNDRDEWISWDPLTRGRRLPLVTQLRRFLVLQSRRAPNLTTRGMGLGRALGAIVTLCRHEDGRPVAMASYSGRKDDGELPVAQKFLKESAAFIENATITSDALHSQKKRIA
jgi:hypothetical protein